MSMRVCLLLLMWWYGIVEAAMSFVVDDPIARAIHHCSSAIICVIAISTAITTGAECQKK